VIEIRIETPDQAEVRTLLEMSDAYMAELYPAESYHLLDVRALGRAEVIFLVARLGARAVGCGAIVLAPHGWAAVKRMFVIPEMRGHKVGRRLLAALERTAIAQGVRMLRLQTGVRQLAALALYRASGFVETEPFGDDRPDPLSIFMEKRLVSATSEVIARDGAARA
jgi:putative acetyltransferase